MRHGDGCNHISFETQLCDITSSLGGTFILHRVSGEEDLYFLQHDWQEGSSPRSDVDHISWSAAVNFYSQHNNTNDVAKINKIFHCDLGTMM